MVVVVGVERVGWVGMGWGGVEGLGGGLEGVERVAYFNFTLLGAIQQEGGDIMVKRREAGQMQDGGVYWGGQRIELRLSTRKKYTVYK